MTTHTTITMHKNSYENLNNLSKNFGFSKSEIIRRVIKILSSENKKFIRQRLSTEYQQKEKGSYKIVHIYLSEVYYDVALDLRRFYRASFSLLIAEALNECYDDIIKLLIPEDIDSYTYGQCHTSVYYKKDGAICWKHFWGIPPVTEFDIDVKYKLE